MDRLRERIGCERPLADEIENECAKVFHDEFAEPLLPRLKFARPAAFRLANLGARYEWGAVPMAEAHFAAPASQEALTEDGEDRIARLLDPDLVPAPLRPLHAALVSARVQASRAFRDIQDHRPHSPTFYLLVWGVTVNRPGPDTEILGGLYTADHRSEARREAYFGLGDDPARYEIRAAVGRLQVADASMGTPGPP